MDRILLIACSKAKLQRAAPARQLYSASLLFRKSLAYAERVRPGAIYVLSARHGLVLPDQVLEPYNLGLPVLSPAARRSWAQGILRELDDRHDLSMTHVIFLAGRLYRQHLEEALPCSEAPMEGMGIGLQLAWLSWQLQIRRCRVCGCWEHDCRQCIEKTGHACHWVEADLCSACVNHS